MPSKLPRLIINESSDSFVYIRITLFIGQSVKGKKLDYFGSVKLKVKRRVSILKTGKTTLADIWDYSYIITGPMSNANTHSRDILDQLVTRFAADWYRDNP